MSVSNNVLAKMKLQREAVLSIDGIVRKDENTFEVIGHAPLEIVELDYRCFNRFWTKNYDPEYSTQFTICEDAFCGQATSSAVYKVQGKRQFFQLEKRGYDTYLEEIIKALNANEMLLKMLSELDILKLYIVRENNIIKTTISVMEGGITKMLIPPITYYTKPDKSSMIKMFQVLQIINATNEIVLKKINK